MEIKEIANYLKKHQSEIIKLLTADNWRHFRKYFFIKDHYSSSKLDEDFERVFCDFYRMNGARGLNKPQKKEFFKLLSTREADLEKIIESIYKIPGYKNNSKIYFVFGTKLLHTINEKLPIYDGNIAYVLDLPAQAYLVSREERIKNRVNIYQELRNDFVALLASQKIRNYLKTTRKHLQIKADFDKFDWQDRLISDTKLLDSSLWALYTVLKRTARMSKVENSNSDKNPF